MVTEPQLAPVVVAVGRTGTGAGVRAAAGEAVRTGRPLHLLHVTPPHEVWLRVVGREALADAVRIARSETRDRVPCDGDLLHGDLLGLLRVRAAAAALVVLERAPGRHRSRPSSVVRLAETLATPTLVVPASWEPADHAVVSVGLDPGAADDAALRTAIIRARLSGSVLRVVVAGAVTRSEVERRLDRLGGDACDVAVEIESGHPFEALLLAAASSDLVVLGRHPVPAPGAAPVGGVGRLLLEALPCPVLLSAPGHVHEARPPAVGADARGGRG